MNYFNTWSSSIIFQTGEKSCHSHCSSQSSNNTLSSNASSGSDDKHFGSGDPMDPESLGLTYIKGASTDSGIDTAPCMPPPPPALPLTGVGPSRMVMRDGRVETGLPWPLEYHEDGETDEGRVKMFPVSRICCWYTHRSHHGWQHRRSQWDLFAFEVRWEGEWNIIIDLFTFLRFGSCLIAYHQLPSSLIICFHFLQLRTFSRMSIIALAFCKNVNCNNVTVCWLN